MNASEAMGKTMGKSIGMTMALSPALALLPALTLAAALVGAVPARAQSVQLLGDFRDWSAYTTANTADKLCFVISKPTAVEPAVEGADQPYFYVSHRPNEAVRYEMNLVSGVTLAPDAPATAQIGGQAFTMFSEADAAWLENIAQSADMAAAMRAGQSMTVEATTERGIRIRQTYSLSGATASMRAIDAECR
ncbi:MAG TPA: invasion associated locus B family protein [Devosiaceae bacterium]|nr:invasion associated locus B family protein [Devosiaceae bacterium]